MRPSRARILSVLAPIALVVLAAGPAAGQDAPAAAPARKQIRAVRIEGRAPAVDGRLDDAAWTAAPVLDDFTQKQPAEGRPATERTEVRFLYDSDALYVALRAFAKDPSKIQAPVSRRDNGGESEHIWISLDTYRDRRTAYSFGVTAAGTRMDWYHPRDDEYETDPSFDPVWEAEAQRDSLGWTAEMRIPFSQLRFVALPEQVWGLNIDRWIPSTEEDDFWIPVPSKERGWASRMGELVGISGIRPTRRLEVMPYVASGATLTAEPGRGNPFNDGSTLNVRAGGDVKMGLGPNLTLEGTVNPDFGQVEADPAEVNLSAFETFFGERRPFFIEGSQLLAGTGPGYFYSRRIGGAPRGDLLDPGFYADLPGTSTILGAAKVTGRLASGTSLGALAALTDREDARTFDPETGELGRVRVAPLSGYAVARAQQEFGADASTAGLILTGVRRDVDGSPLASLLGRQALTGGADWNLRFRGGEYSVSGYAGFSHVEGDSAWVLRLQRSSARYFQRPDADYVEVDPSRTALSGYTAGVEVDRNNGRHWIWEVGAAAESPGFELNDLGSLSTTDDLVAYGQLRYRETQPGPFLRNYAVYVTPSAEWNYGGERTGGSLFFDAEATFLNLWRANFTTFVDPRAQSDDATRGGPLMGLQRSWAVIGQLSSRGSAPTRWNGRIYYGENEEGGPTYRFSGGVSIRPGPRWQLSVNPNFVRYTYGRQYVSRVDSGGPAATFGSRYVFARLDQRTFLAPVRLNYTFSPDLTLEMYVEPFAASGRFYAHGELPAARSYDLRRYGTDGTRISQSAPGGSYLVQDGGRSFSVPFRDFNVRSLRSNAVMRWEWRPGSTLFLVWQQDRGSEEAQGVPVGLTDIGDAFSTRGDNRFVVKMTYWFPVT